MAPALLVLVCLAGAPQPLEAYFEGDSLVVGRQRVTDARPLVKVTPFGAVIASRSVIEPLSAIVEVVFDDDHVLILEPGVRLIRTEEGYELMRHGRGWIRFGEGPNGQLLRKSPVRIGLSPSGWDFGGGLSIPGDELRAGLLAGAEEEKKEEITHTGGEGPNNYRMMFWENPAVAANAGGGGPASQGGAPPIASPSGR